MIYAVPFEAKHFTQMLVQKEQEWLKNHATVESLSGLEGPYASTLMCDGRPLACAGAAPYEPHRALVWSFLSDEVDRWTFPYVHAEAVKFLARLPFRRLEASVLVGFEQGHRWMRLLGFTVEAPLQRAFLPDGSDCVGYVKIKE